jgi:hypothetical protein
MTPEEHKITSDKIIKYLFVILILGIIIHYYFSENIKVNFENIIDL